MRVRIKRQDGPDSPAYYQEFIYGGAEQTPANEHAQPNAQAPANEQASSSVGTQAPATTPTRVTVAKILDDINYLDDPVDVDGNQARRISWECSCMQKVCGACAMVINGMPRLACDTFVNLAPTTGAEPTLTLEPLTKFPVICDLVVDRSCILEHQKQAEVYIGTFNKESGTSKYASEMYDAAKCLKCGLCLEVCPNYAKDAKDFFGAAYANEAFVSHASTADRQDELKKSYSKHFAKGCSKALSCRDICPAKIPTLSSISYMNKT